MCCLFRNFWIEAFLFPDSIFKENPQLQNLRKQTQDNIALFSKVVLVETIKDCRSKDGVVYFIL